MKTFRVFIAGAGRGGSKLLEVFSESSYVELAGIYDINPQAPGLKLAKELKVETFTSAKDIKVSKINIAVNVTGNPKVSEELKNIFPAAEVMGGESALLLFSVVSDYSAQSKLYSALYEAIVHLLKKENQNEVLSTIVNMAKIVVDAPAGSLALYDKKDTRFFLATSSGFSKNLLSISSWKARSNGLTRKIMESQGDVFTVEDLTGVDFEINEILKKEGIKSLAAAPLRVNGSFLGILYVDDFRPRFFTDYERKALALFAQIAALALQKFRLIEQARELAITDGLTGIFNYRHFQERLRQEIAKAKRMQRELSIIIFDLDHFKKYNDANGHLVGDEALRRVANILRNHCRESDIPARYGGEEFVLVLPETSKPQAKIVAERIRLTIEQTRFEGEEALPLRKLTLSAGIASYPEDGDEASQVIREADNALYEAKVSGRNLVVLAGEPVSR